MEKKKKLLSTAVFDLVELLMMAVYGVARTHSLLGGIFAVILCSILLLVWAILKTIVMKLDKYAVREKFPNFLRDFLRKDPDMQREAIKILAALLLMTLVINNYWGSLINNLFFAWISLISMLLFGLFLFAIFTKFPNMSGRIVTYEEVKMLMRTSNLEEAYVHFDKATKFFVETSQPDRENCVKEAICALEAYLFKETGEHDFNDAVKKLEGKEKRQIPGAIADGMKKLYAYRGNAKGVAHGKVEGSTVTTEETELALNLVSSYLLYVHDLLSTKNA